MGIHDGHRQRLKTEFMARPETFPDHKILEVLLFYVNPRGDTNPTAHALLEQFGTLAGVLDATPEELQKVKGVGEHAAVLLKCVKEAGGRYLTARSSVEDIVDRTAVAYGLLRPYFFGARNERVCVLCMDGKHKALGVRLVCEGNVNAVEVTSRRIMEVVLSLNATNVILAHNHVSGLAFPSAEDKQTTQHLRGLLANVGVELLDHLIFTDDDAVSLRDSGFFAVN